MSHCYYIKCEDYLDLEAFQGLVQRHLGEETRICLKLQEEAYGGQFYIDGQSTRGIEISKEQENIVVRIPLLADYADFFLGKLFLDIFHQFLGQDVLDEEGNIIEVREYFSDETVQKMRELDSQIFCHLLKNMDSELTLSCVVSDVLFGKGEAEHFIQCQLDLAELTQRLTSYIGGVQWGDSESEDSIESSSENPTKETPL